MIRLHGDVSVYQNLPKALPIAETIADMDDGEYYGHEENVRQAAGTPQAESQS